MKIALSVFGRFHIFNTAKELEKKGVLNQFYTSYPKFMVDKYEIKPAELKTYPSLELLNRLRRKVLNKFFPESLWLKKKYDKKISKSLKANNDIYIAWGGYCLDSMIKAKSFKQSIILEAGSAHPEYVRKILTEEYESEGLKAIVDSIEHKECQLKAIEMADYISIPSSFVKKTFIANGVDEGKLIVNPYGVDLSKFKQIEKLDEKFRVIYCGALSLQKGSHYLLKAIYELNIDNIEFWHIGNILEEMKPIIKKYQSDNIIFKGAYPQDELYKLYSQGSVFVMPSIQEGLAMVQLQAMACGLPLICTTNTGGDDLIRLQGEEGYVIPIRDSNAIKDKVLYLYNNPKERIRMGNSAKKRVETGYSWKDYGDRYFDNLEAIMKKRKK